MFRLCEPRSCHGLTGLCGHIRLRSLSSRYCAVPWRLEKEDKFRGLGLLGEQHSRILQLFELSTPSHSALISLYCEAYQMCSPPVQLLSPLPLFTLENWTVLAFFYALFHWKAHKISTKTWWLLTCKWLHFPHFSCCSVCRVLICSPLHVTCGLMWGCSPKILHQGTTLCSGLVHQRWREVCKSKLQFQKTLVLYQTCLVEEKGSSPMGPCTVSNVGLLWELGWQ